jgi:hypothetical protein
MKFLNYLGLYKCEVCDKIMFLPSNKQICNKCDKEYRIKIRTLFVLLAEKNILKSRELFNFKFYNLYKELFLYSYIAMIEQPIFKIFGLEEDDINDLFRLVKYEDNVEDYFDFLVTSSYVGIEDK